MSCGIFPSSFPPWEKWPKIDVESSIIIIIRRIKNIAAENLNSRTEQQTEKITNSLPNNTPCVPQLLRRNQPKNALSTLVGNFVKLLRFEQLVLKIEFFSSASSFPKKRNWKRKVFSLWLCTCTCLKAGYSHNFTPLTFSHIALPRSAYFPKNNCYGKHTENSLNSNMRFGEMPSTTDTKWSKLNSKEHGCEREREKKMSGGWAGRMRKKKLWMNEASKYRRATHFHFLFASGFTGYGTLPRAKKSG